jgi:Kef-type K+ transport system membrane component KefB
MIYLTNLATEMAWPITIILAWIIGELAHRWLKLPHISVYAIVGFALAPSQLGLLPQPSSYSMLILANMALGLILFESGYRINLRWLKTNPWIGVTSITETALTFGAIYFLVREFHVSLALALLLAALAMATSPATILCVINEQRSAGQVTERTLHLSVLNCVLAVFIFKIIVGLMILKTSGNIWHATYTSLTTFFISVLLGAIFGLIVPAFLRIIRSTHRDSTLALALAVIFLVLLTHTLKQSPILASLTFGLVARQRHIVLSSSQRGFGVLGSLLAMILFVFVATTLDWHRVIAGIGLGLAIIMIRYLAKIIGISCFSYVSGITHRQGFLIATAMTPISAFVILVLEQSRYLGINLVEQLAPLAAIALIIEVLGPVLTRLALLWAHEISDKEDL